MRISDWSSDVCSSDLGQKDGVVAQGPEFLSDRREELLLIAAREVGAADRALEQYVADDRELRWLVVKDDMPRRVPRTVDDVEGPPPDTPRADVVPPAIRTDTTPAPPAPCPSLAAPPEPNA